MEKKTQPTLITTSETALRANLLATGLRLTPTGKISHAKTRVYTQRYRKEWEQMPDFKGWLTSVPFQPTRAYCTYCKKNLHAHRLSLLKHTCTMKHQRAALMHEAEEKKKRLKSDSEADVEVEEGNDDDLEGMENAQGEMEENDDESEYVVERLDMYDEEMEESQLKTDNVVDEEEEEEEEEDEENDVNLSMASDEEDVKPIIKKLKVESMGCRDTLAEAMAHVHSEYLEEADDQGNVQIEMVVESEEQSNPEMQVMTVLPDSEDGDKDDELKESDENERSNRRADARNEKLSGEECKPSGDQDIMVACSLPILGTAYQISPSVAQASSTIGVLQSVNTIPISGSQSKTITFTSGGKTLTLTGGTFQPGTQYVLNKVKGKMPTLVMAAKKPSGNRTEEDAKPVQSSKIAQEQSAVAGTSQQFSKKHLLLNPLKFDKKPRISTHVMDTTKGLPVGGLQVSLYKLMDGRWTFLNESNTSPNGRCANLVENMKINFTAGRYKIHFDVDKYFTLRRIETMYPFIEIVFDVKNPASHYHIPVLLSPFGYTTYRGSER